MRTRTIMFAACLLASLAAGCADRAPRVNEAAGDPVARSEAMTGEEYAAQLGLIPHEYRRTMELGTQDGGVSLDGKLLEGCEGQPKDVPSAFTIVQTADRSGVLYCFTADSELQLWVIGQKLNGHVPTEEEMAVRREELQRCEEASETC